MSAILADKEQH